MQVREWTQYSLVNKAWKAAFQDVCLCIVFSEVHTHARLFTGGFC